MRKLLIANWKENPATEKEAVVLFGKIALAKRGSNVHVVVCPPSLYLSPIAKKIKALRSKKNLAIGAQDVFWKDKGAFTGAVGPAMLKNLGVQYAIVGHSERRNFFHETDGIVAQKVSAALAAGLTVVLCVGEPLAVREKGAAAAERFVHDQLKKGLAMIDGAGDLAKNLIIAYEPIWAIGTGRNADPKDADGMAAFIKKTLSVTCLYGGSVAGKNVNDYVDCKHIDGALVGGASLDAKEFGSIVESVGK